MLKNFFFLIEHSLITTNNKELWLQSNH